MDCTLLSLDFSICLLYQLLDENTDFINRDLCLELIEKILNDLNIPLSQARSFVFQSSIDDPTCRELRVSQFIAVYKAIYYDYDYPGRDVALKEFEHAAIKENIKLPVFS